MLSAHCCSVNSPDITCPSSSAFRTEKTETVWVLIGAAPLAVHPCWIPLLSTHFFYLFQTNQEHKMNNYCVFPRKRLTASQITLTNVKGPFHQTWNYCWQHVMGQRSENRCCCFFFSIFLNQMIQCYEHHKPNTIHLHYSGVGAKWPDNTRFKWKTLYYLTKWPFKAHVKWM